MTLDQKLVFSRETARASSERDKALAMLKLDKADLADDLVARLYTTRPALPAPSVNGAVEDPQESAGGQGGVEDK
jgi:hypothetical protein